MAASATHSAIDAVWRIESARLIAGLTRVVGDVTVAEDLAQDALVAALEQWPQAGIPERPGAWLMATAKHRGIDALRRRATLERKRELIGRELEILRQLDQPDLVAQVDDVPDDVLGLIFMTCHPVLSREARIALTLRLVGGLSTPEIARAFLASEGTVAQRIVRAKRTLAQAQVPFEVPGRGELADRLSAVLEVVYLVFNEGYAATSGEHWTRPALCQDAMRLGRILAALMPREPEVCGLLALMELQASRLRARIGPGGEPVLLGDQDRARWDHLLVQRGLAGLTRAEELSGALGPYTLQAAIAGCHARARSVEETDWPRIVALYDGLSALTGSPVVELNRAVAVTMAFGPEAGLELLDTLAGEPALRSYHLLPSVRGDLLVRLGRPTEAREEFVRAADLCDNDRERELLLSRALACGTWTPGCRQDRLARGPFAAPGGFPPGGLAPGGLAPGGLAPGGLAPGGLARGGFVPGDLGTGRGARTGGLVTCRDMARTPREVVAGGTYHVWARGVRQEPMFREDEDREVYLDLWGDMVGAGGWRSLAYCLMRNHVHHLVEVPELGLGTGVGLAHRRYSTWFNRKYGHVGRSFQERFGSSLAKDEATILYFAGYVVLNPVRAELVDRPEDHAWSSHAAVLGTSPRPRWLDDARLLERFGGLEQYRQVIDTLRVMGAAGFARPTAPARGRP